jgi:hypothetical protein
MIKENKKMRKNIFLILLVAAIFVFVGTVHQSAKAVDDLVQFIKNAKTPVHFHSLAGGVTCIPGISDSLINNQASVVGTWWHSIYPPNTFDSAFWKVQVQRDNGTFGLNPSDTLRIGFYKTYPPGAPGDSLWVHVEDVTITLILTKEPDHLDTMYVEFVRGWKNLHSAFVDSAIYPPVVGDTLHEIWPEYSRIYQLTSWADSGLPHNTLSCSDTIDLTEWWHVISVTKDSVPPNMTLWLTMEDRDGQGENRLLKFTGEIGSDSLNQALHNPVSTWWHEESPHYCNWWQIHSWIDTPVMGILDSCDYVDFVTYWHVEDVAIDIEVLSIPNPTVPTMTQWGIIILVALLIGSGVFVMLRRRKAAVPA